MGNSLIEYRAAIGLFHRCRTVSTVTDNYLFTLLSHLCTFLLMILCVRTALSSASCSYLSLPLIYIIRILYLNFRTVCHMSRFCVTKVSIIPELFVKRVVQFQCFLTVYLLIDYTLLYVYGYNQRLILLSGDIELNPGPNNLSICHINIRGLSSAKLLTIKHDIQSKFDIITLSESFLSETSTHDLYLNGYHPIIRKDRDIFGGGVAVYLSNNLSYQRLQNIEIPDTECLWLEVNSKYDKFILAVHTDLQTRTLVSGKILNLCTMLQL